MKRNIKELNEVDLSEEGVFYIKGGKVYLIDALPYGYGRQTITWQNGEIIRTELAYSRKV